MVFFSCLEANGLVATPLDPVEGGKNRGGAIDDVRSAVYTEPYPACLTTYAIAYSATSRKTAQRLLEASIIYYFCCALLCLFPPEGKSGTDVVHRTQRLSLQQQSFHLLPLRLCEEYRPRGKTQCTMHAPEDIFFDVSETRART